MKNTTDIQELLDRYWEGETSLEEERTLRDFFAAEPVPEQFSREAALFRVLRADQAIEMPGNRIARLASRQQQWRVWSAAATVALLLTAGAWWWLTRTGPVVEPTQQIAVVVAPPVSQTPAPAISEPAPQTKPAKAKVPRHNRRRYQPKVTPQVPRQDSFDDPELALAEIKAALSLVSSKINKGKKEIGKGLHEVETLDKIIKKKSDG